MVRQYGLQTGVICFTYTARLNATWWSRETPPQLEDVSVYHQTELSVLSASVEAMTLSDGMNVPSHLLSMTPILRSPNTVENTFYDAHAHCTVWKTDETSSSLCVRKTRLILSSLDIGLGNICRPNAV